MNNITKIFSEKAPKAIGPYTQAIQCGSWLFISGQIGVDAKSGCLIQDSIEAETQQALNNLGFILEKSGIMLSNVVKTTVFVTNMQDFDSINTVYADFFSDHYPARSCVEVSQLPKGARVEIEAIACCDAMK